MQGKAWSYYILDDQGRSYRKENGMIVPKTSPKRLLYTPDGWQDISIAWERSLTRFGLTRNFTLPLGFVIDGAEILRYLDYRNNFDLITYLLILKEELEISDDEYYFWNKYFYKAELDLTTLEDEENKVTVSVMEGGLSKDLKANENTTYEFDVNVPEALTVKMDGLKLVGRINYGIVLEVWAGNNKTLFPSVFLNNEGSNFNFIYQNEIGDFASGINNLINDIDFSNSDKYYIKATGNVSITIKLKGTFTVRGNFFPPGGANVHYQFKYATSLGQSGIAADITASGVFNGTKIDVDESSAVINLVDGESLFWYQQAPEDAGAYTGAFDDDTKLSFEFIDRFRTTYIKVLPIDYVFGKIVEKIAGNSIYAQSALLSSKKNLVISSGEEIRGLENAKIKTSFRDFDDSFNVILNTGSGVENNKIVIEEKEHFFNTENPIHLGKAKKVKTKKLTELFVNSIKIGYQNQNYDDVNGRDEPNTTHIYTSIIKRIGKELSLISKYRADAYGIEFTRTNLEGRTTTDNSSDNDVFIINIDYDNPQTDPVIGTYYNLKRETYDSITGLISPDTIFNIEELTPKRLALKHQNYWNSIFHGFEMSELGFETTDKNAELVTVKNDETIIEKGNVKLSTTPRLFIPRIFEFEPESMIEIVELMQENPNRCFSFEHPNGNIYKGFNLRIGLAANTLKEQVFQLIMAPDTDLKTLG
jgi:hypothetical protein